MKRLVRAAFKKFGYDIRRHNDLSNTIACAINFNQKISPETHKFIFEKLPEFIDLIQKCDADIEVGEGGSLMISIEGLRFNVQTSEEIFILREIFYEGIYNLSLPHNCIVVDIGMNVGIASLYFAKNNNVKQVYGFEPFDLTLEKAIDNFSINKPVSKKIIYNNKGLGKENKEIDVDYTFDVKGSVGIDRFPEWYLGGERFKKRIRIIDASLALEEIIDKNLDSEIVMKIDCEGSEYDVVESLYDKNILKRISAIMIEWHNFEKNKILFDLLTLSNFRILNTSPYGRNIGMIYGFRA